MYRSPYGPTVCLSYRLCDRTVHQCGGRLDTARRALELLCAKTKKEADLLAGDLKALNDSRKNLTEEAVKEAVVQVETTGLKEDKVLVVYLPKCHESIAGICGRTSAGAVLQTGVCPDKGRRRSKRLRAVD